MKSLQECSYRSNGFGILIRTVLVATWAWPAAPISAQMIYWTDGSDNTIQRATVNGDDIVTLISSGLDRPDGIAVDPSARKMYWAEWGGRIHRADLDGNNLELLVDAGGMPRDVALDLVNDKLYWIHETPEGIQRANLDGSNVETVRDSAFSAGSAIALDDSAGKLYWGGGGALHRMNLDGTQEELHLVTNNGAIRRVDLSVFHEHIYWANTQFTFIAWDGFDGNGDGMDDILQTIAEPFDLAVDSENEVFFWTEIPALGAGAIKRADFSGANVTTIIPAGLTLPHGMAIGPAPDAGGAVPGVSSWGMGVMALLVLVASSIILSKRRAINVS